MNIDYRNEETGKWIIIDYFPNSPADVYGLFDTEKDARDYAERHGFGKNGGAYDIKSVLNAFYQEEPFDPVASGWVGKDGRP